MVLQRYEAPRLLPRERERGDEETDARGGGERQDDGDDEESVEKTTSKKCRSRNDKLQASVCLSHTSKPTRQHSATVNAGPGSKRKLLKTLVLAKELVRAQLHVSVVCFLRIKRESAWLAATWRVQVGCLCVLQHPSGHALPAASLNVESGMIWPKGARKLIDPSFRARQEAKHEQPLWWISNLNQNQRESRESRPQAVKRRRFGNEKAEFSRAFWLVASDAATVERGSHRNLKNDRSIIDTLTGVNLELHPRSTLSSRDRASSHARP